jgi:hypothetical protein
LFGGGGCHFAASASSAASAAIWRRNRAMKSSTTSLSSRFGRLLGRLRGAGSLLLGLLQHVISILVARRLAPADSLTGWVATASRSVISRRSPWMVATAF